MHSIHQATPLHQPDAVHAAAAGSTAKPAARSQPSTTRAPIDEPDSDGKRPLQQALAEGWCMVSAVLSQAPSLDLLDEPGRASIFIEAASYNDAHSLKILVREAEVREAAGTRSGSSLHEALNWVDGKGRSALWTASANGYDDHVDFMLRYDTLNTLPPDARERRVKLAGVDVDQPCDESKTPVFAAAEAGHHKTITLLTNYGASLSKCDNRGNNPFHAAARTGFGEATTALLNAAHDRGRVSVYLGKKNHDGRTPAMEAVEQGHLDPLKEMLDYDAEKGNFVETEYEDEQPMAVDLEEEDAEGNTLLNIAAGKGNTEAARMVIETARERKNLRDIVNLSNRQGYTPVLHAANAGNEELALLLLRSGASAAAKLHNGETLLHIAIRQNMPKLVHAILRIAEKNSRVSDMLDETNKSDGNTPMLLAVELGRQEIVQQLANHDVEFLFSQNRARQTPLYRAAMKNDLPMIDRLIAVANKSGMQILTRMFFFSHEEAPTVRADIEATQHDRSLDGPVVLEGTEQDRREGLDIARYGDPGFLQDELDESNEALEHFNGGRRAMVRARVEFDQRGETAIMGAIRHQCNKATILKLFNFGAELAKNNMFYANADLEQLNVSGYNLLHHAANVDDGIILKTTMDRIRTRDVTLLPRMIAAGNDDQETPLMMAANNESGEPHAVEQLLAEGADPTATDKLDRNAFHYAMLRGTVRMGEMLLDAADRQGKKEEVRDALDAYGDNPLLIAASGGNTAMFGYLVSNGAKLFHTNKDDESALYRAADSGDAETVRAVLQAEQEAGKETWRLPRDPLINQARKGGATPLIAAAERRSAQAVSLLLEHGADLTRRTEGSGSSALHKAIGGRESEESIAVIDALLQHARNSGSELRPDCVRILDLLTARNNDGETALDVAMRRGNKGVTYRLFQAELAARTEMAAQSNATSFGIEAQSDKIALPDNKLLLVRAIGEHGYSEENQNLLTEALRLGGEIHRDCPTFSAFLSRVVNAGEPDPIFVAALLPMMSETDIFNRRDALLGMAFNLALRRQPQLDIKEAKPEDLATEQSGKWQRENRQIKYSALEIAAKVGALYFSRATSPQSLPTELREDTINRDRKNHASASGKSLRAAAACVIAAAHGLPEQSKIDDKPFAALRNALRTMGLDQNDARSVTTLASALDTRRRQDAAGLQIRSYFDRNIVASPNEEESTPA